MKNVQRDWTRPGSIAFILIAALALAGCADDDLPAAGGSGTSGTSDSDTPGSDDNPAPDGDDEADAQSGYETPADCLVDEWVADNVKFGALMASLMEDGGSIDSVTGTVLVTFTSDGRTSTDYSDWTFTMSHEGQTVTVVRNGTDGGDYTVESNSKLTMNETASNSTVVMKAAGGVFSTQPGTDALPLSHAEFSCSAELLTIVSDGAPIDFTRR